MATYGVITNYIKNLLQITAGVTGALLQITS